MVAKIYTSQSDLHVPCLCKIMQTRKLLQQKHKNMLDKKFKVETITYDLSDQVPA